MVCRQLTWPRKQWFDSRGITKPWSWPLKNVDLKVALRDRLPASVVKLTQCALLLESIYFMSSSSVTAGYLTSFVDAIQQYVAASPGKAILLAIVCIPVLTIALGVVRQLVSIDYCRPRVL